VQGATREIAHFVTGPWSQVIAQARLQDPAGSVDPGGYTALLSDLLWSAIPRLASGNPGRLARMVPPLLEQLRRGLASIDYPAPQAERFFSHLIELHQQALRPAAAVPERPVPLSTRLSREELEAQFGDDPDGTVPWLGPGEARESGFMDTHDSTPAQPLFQPTQPGGVAGSAAPDAMDAVPRLGEAGLQPGAWVEMSQPGGWQRLQLTWASPHGTLFMFTDSVGGSHSMTRRLLDQMVAAGSLRLFSDQALVEGALDAVAQKALSNSLDVRL
jgi:hypothetical protein